MYKLKKKKVESRYSSHFVLSHHVTLHACERFVERVFGLDKSKLKGRETKVKEHLLEQVLMYIGINGRIKVPLKDYPDCLAVLENGVIVTVYKK